MPRILIIDDDETSRELVRESLKDEYEIVETGDAESAIMLALEKKPDAILLDVTRSKLSGFELCQALSSLSFTRHIPVFIVNAGDPRNKAFSESLGAAGYFEKPINFARLKARLKTAIQPKGANRRKDVRFQVKLTLKLVGTDRDGKSFEANAITDDMSAGGFLCSCSALLELGTIVDVFLFRDGEHHLGTARPVRKEISDPARPRYGFSFTTKIEPPTG